MSRRFLVIQTAFIGDAILASALLEELHLNFPGAKIDFLLRKGNDKLFQQHPFIDRLLVWDKSRPRWSSMRELIKEVRRVKYDRLINLHRFASSGFISSMARAETKAGFDKNPFSFVYDRRVKHEISAQSRLHEVDRNAKLIEDISDQRVRRPGLYPGEKERQGVEIYKNKDYLCIAPASVWYTKQWPAEKWVELLRELQNEYVTYLIGAPEDADYCENIRAQLNEERVVNLAGKLSLLESAALMQDAVMNYVNDSAPLHLASAVNANVTAVFCSTVPAFGFGPLSGKSFVVEKNDSLYCRPCGLHGKKSCPEGHFKCAYDIRIDQLMESLKRL